jgi:Fungal protein kinase
MLIDFDLAVSVDEDGRNERTEEQVMTGTLEFITIEILEGALRKSDPADVPPWRLAPPSYFWSDSRLQEPHSDVVAEMCPTSPISGPQSVPWESRAEDRRHYGL